MHAAAVRWQWTANHSVGENGVIWSSGRLPERLPLRVEVLRQDLQHLLQEPICGPWCLNERNLHTCHSESLSLNAKNSRPLRSESNPTRPTAEGKGLIFASMFAPHPGDPTRRKSRGLTFDAQTAHPATARVVRPTQSQQTVHCDVQHLHRATARATRPRGFTNRFRNERHTGTKQAHHFARACAVMNISQELLRDATQPEKHAHNLARHFARARAVDILLQISQSHDCS